MKKIYLGAFVICQVAFCSAQEVVSTQGDSYTSSTTTIDFTIGEPIINSLASSNSQLTQGFHQTKWEFVFIIENSTISNVMVYPNPTDDYIILEVENYDEVNYSLVDVNGKVLRQEIVKDTKSIISVQDLSAGNYFLFLKKNNQIFNSIKLNKYN